MYVSPEVINVLREIFDKTVFIGTGMVLQYWITTQKNLEKARKLIQQPDTIACKNNRHFFPLDSFVDDPCQCEAMRIILQHGERTVAPNFKRSDSGKDLSPWRPGLH